MMKICKYVRQTTDGKPQTGAKRSFKSIRLHSRQIISKKDGARFIQPKFKQRTFHGFVLH